MTQALEQQMKQAREDDASDAAEKS